MVVPRPVRGEPVCGQRGPLCQGGSHHSGIEGEPRRDHQCALAALARRPDKGGSAAPDRLDLACGVVVTPQAQEHGRRVAGLVAQDDRLAHLAGEALALEPWRIQVGRYLDPPNGGREAGGHMRSISTLEHGDAYGGEA